MLPWSRARLAVLTDFMLNKAKHLLAPASYLMDAYKSGVDYFLVRKSNEFGHP